MSKYFHKLKVKEVIYETINAVSIIFDVPEELKADFKYDAGQHLTVKANVKGEDVRRSYSIPSWTEEGGELKITSKMIPNGKMSSYLFNEVKEGQELEVMPPMGNFVLKNDAQDKTLVFFAGGSGITPVISVIKKALAKGNQDIYLHYGNRDPEQIIFEKELQELKDNSDYRFLIQHYLDSNMERLDVSIVQAIVNSLKEKKTNAIFYICGPEGMIEGVQNGLKAAGVEKNQMVVEYFETPEVAEGEKKTTEVSASGDVHKITIVIDDEEHEITMDEGEFILEAAERIGVDPPFSCRSGVCTTCKAKIISGEVEMENNFGLSEDEIKEGYVLTCIGRPLTPGVKVSWDDV